jgi:polyisoprenoid-binding protein YceI
MVMISGLQLCLLAAALTGPATPSSANLVWAGDPTHSTVNVSVTDFFISKVRGRIPIASATVVTTDDPTVPVDIQATLDAASLDTNNPSRDADLRSPHFFDTARYPTIVFDGDHITETGPSAFTIDGELTMRGVTHPLRLDGHVDNVTDAAGTRRVRFDATGHFHRTDYGMTYARGVVGNDVALNIVLEAIEKRT